MTHLETLQFEDTGQRWDLKLQLSAEARFQFALYFAGGVVSF